MFEKSLNNYSKLLVRSIERFLGKGGGGGDRRLHDRSDGSAEHVLAGHTVIYETRCDSSNENLIKW